VRVLQQYKGTLTPAQAACGINAAVVNARRLAEDAKLLLEARRCPSAASFAILSLEELGKCAILRELLAAPSDLLIQDCWQRYRRHTEKNYLALLPDRVRGGAKHLYDLRDLFSKAGKAERVTFDTIKQLGFYSDCCGTAHWSMPSEVVDLRLATELVSLAWSFVRKQGVDHGSRT
jgi:AbiV family abortive infection protein